MVGDSRRLGGDRRDCSGKNHYREIMGTRKAEGNVKERGKQDTYRRKGPEKGSLEADKQKRNL